MNRLHGAGYREAISAAYDVLTPRLRDRLDKIGFVCGVSPVFIGLRDWGEMEFYDGTKVSYEDLIATWNGKDHGLLDDQTTIVFPRIDLYRFPVASVLHELGHALHKAVGWIDVSEETTEYSKTNSHEAFAEAFELWAGRGLPADHRPADHAIEVAALAPQSLALFEYLS